MSLLLQILLLFCLLAIMYSEIRFGVVNLAIIGCGVLVALIGIGLHMPWLPNFSSAILASSVAVIFFLWQYVLSKGQWVGSGDAWLGALLGVLAGWHTIVLVLAVGYGLAAIAAFVLILFFKQKQITRVPLGAFLSIASLLFLLVTIVR